MWCMKSGRIWGSEMSQLFTFGIDLGTTNSCIAFSKEGMCTVIPSASGKRTFPSYVAFQRDKLLVGEAAKNQVAANIANTVYDAKRLIGHKYNEEGVKDDLNHWGFKVKPDNSGNPEIEVEFEGKKIIKQPQEISAYLLKDMARQACDHCGINQNAGKHAVITVPAYFNDIQRRATIEAGELAGLNVLQIINEPTAAAIAYGYKYVNQKKNRIILVYDFGGGTFDVSIIEVKNNEITVRATGGDTHLGGEDINSNLVNYYVDKLKKETNIDLHKDPKKLWKLRNACEEAKIQLSELNETDVASTILEDNDINNILTRPLFNKLNEKIFQSTIEIMRQTLSDSGLSKDQIDDVVLIGGSSRIPEVQRLLLQFFPDNTLNQDINPDEAVAIGAGLLAEDLGKGLLEVIDNNGCRVIIDAASGEIIQTQQLQPSQIQQQQQQQQDNNQFNPTVINIHEDPHTPSINTIKKESVNPNPIFSPPSFPPPPPSSSSSDNNNNVIKFQPPPQSGTETTGEEETEPKSSLAADNSNEFAPPIDPEFMLPVELQDSPSVAALMAINRNEQKPGYRNPIRGNNRMLNIHDVLTHNIGIDTSNDLLNVILPKNSVIPCEKEKKGFKTGRDNATNLIWDFYQGENEIASKNPKLYSYKLDNLPLKKNGVLKFDVKMSINENGLLDVKITEENNMVSESHLTITVGSL